MTEIMSPTHLRSEGPSRRTRPAQLSQIDELPERQSEIQETPIPSFNNPVPNQQVEQRFPEPEPLPHHQELSNDIRVTRPRLSYSQRVEKQIEQLDIAEKHSVAVIIGLRYMIIIQPLVGLFGGAVSLLAIFLYGSFEAFPYLCLITPFFLLLFAAGEISFIAGHLKSFLIQAILFNIINKSFYAAELVLLGLSFKDTFYMNLNFGLFLLHFVFLLGSYYIKTKREVFFYLVSFINPLILITFLLLQLRFGKIFQLDTSICFIPPLLFCFGYLSTCFYFGFILCKAYFRKHRDERRR